MEHTEIENYMQDVVKEIERLTKELGKAKLAGEKNELRARIRSYQDKLKELNESK